MTSRLAGGIAVLLLAGCAGGVTLPASRAPLPTEPPPPAAATSVERAIHDLVNARRDSRGLRALAWNGQVADLAREHSRMMASGRRPFGHDGFQARSASIARLLTLRGIAENVAYDSRSGPGLAERVVDGWIASAGHRANIEGDFTVTGVGAARADDGLWYFTQIFVQAE